MKKIIFCFMMACLPMTFLANEPKVNSDSIKAEQASAAAKVLMQRLEILKAKDKSNLSWKEKREIRKEVKSIDNQLRGLRQRFIIAVGAIVIIALVLIILL